MLGTMNQMAIRMDGFFGSRTDVARFITNLNQMIRGFVAGKPYRRLRDGRDDHTGVVGYWHERRAMPLRIASELLNLLSFLGLIVSLALLLAAALLQTTHRGTIQPPK
jgi:hypothetical protein